MCTLIPKKRQGKPRDDQEPVGKNATAVKSKAEKEKLLQEHDLENTKSFALRDALAHFGIPEYHWLLALLVFSDEISPHVQVAGDAVAAGVLKEAKRRVEAIRKLFDREILLNQAALLADLHWAREKAEREAREKKMLQSLHKIHELQKARQLAQMGIHDAADITMSWPSSGNDCMQEHHVVDHSFSCCEGVFMFMFSKFCSTSPRHQYIKEFASPCVEIRSGQLLLLVLMQYYGFLDVVRSYDPSQLHDNPSRGSSRRTIIFCNA